MFRSPRRFVSSPAFVPAFAVSVAVAALLLAAAPQTARAQVTLLSNLSAGTSKDYTPLTASGGQQAVAFTTGSTAYTLNSVQLNLFYTSPNPPFSIIILTLYTPSTVGGSDPGTSIGTFGGQAIFSDSPMLTTYTASTITLAANTRYVLLADYAGAGDGAWDFSSPLTLPSAQNGSGFSDVVYRTSTDDGSSYTTSTNYNLFALNGTAIAALPPTAAPEPSTLPLLGMGLVTGAGMVGGVRRRKAKTAAV